MKKLVASLILFAVVSIGFGVVSAHAASQYVPVRICHLNADGTYTSLSLLFTTSDQAQLLSYGGVNYVNYKGKDIWPPFTWSGQYSEVNVPGSLWYVHSYYPDTAHRAIYANGCVAP